MKKKKIGLEFKNKKISLNVFECNEFEKFTGLMFSQRQDARALLFDFKKSSRISLHSFFVFFPFVAIWLDDKNKIIDLKLIKPFKLGVSPKKPFYKIIEIPANKKYNSLKKLLVGD